MGWGPTGGVGKGCCVSFDGGVGKGCCVSFDGGVGKGCGVSFAASVRERRIRENGLPGG